MLKENVFSFLFPFDFPFFPFFFILLSFSQLQPNIAIAKVLRKIKEREFTLFEIKLKKET